MRETARARVAMTASGTATTNASAMLHDLYATEGRALPQQGVDAFDEVRPANVVALKRPGCQ